MSSFKGRLLHWRGLALANPWAFLATFLLGGMVAFVYSYVPLHTVNNRKVDRLEVAVLEKETRIDLLERQLAAIEQGDAGAPDEAQVAALETERDEAARARDLAEKELKTAKRRVRSLEGERAQWKKKIAALENDLEAERAVVASTPAAAPSPAAGTEEAPPMADSSAAEAVPASPAPDLAGEAPSKAVAGATPPGATAD